MNSLDRYRVDAEERAKEIAIGRSRAPYFRGEQAQRIFIERMKRMGVVAYPSIGTFTWVIDGKSVANEDVHIVYREVKSAFYAAENGLIEWAEEMERVA